MERCRFKGGKSDKARANVTLPRVYLSGDMVYIQVDGKTQNALSLCGIEARNV